MVSVSLRDSVGNDAVGLAGKIQRMAVGEVAAVGEIQSQNGVAGLKHRSVGLHVGLRSGMGLHVGIFGAEELFGAVAGQVLDHVGEFAAAVVAFAGISFGVLVGEHRSHGFEHGFADEIFGGDQLQAFMLALSFMVDGRGHLGIGFKQGARHRGIFHGGHFLNYLIPSRASIFPIRFLWRSPPGNGVPSQRSTMLKAVLSSSRRPPRASTLASLCSRLN